MKRDLSHLKPKVLAKLLSRRIIDGNCWRYDGATNGDSNYKRMHFAGKNIRIHRLSAWIHLDFDLDSQLEILHAKECRFKDCWNPLHLRSGSHFDNAQDERKEFCHRGHELKYPNLYIYGARRICKECQKLTAANRYQKLKLKCPS